jgi:NTP pyrophosphatase (non-canonical NTP hydrolase)
VTNLEDRIKAYMQQRHKGVTVPQLFRKLGEEVGELGEAIADNRTGKYVGKPDIEHEVGDCALVLAMILLTRDKSLGAMMATVLDEQEERLRTGERVPDDVRSLMPVLTRIGLNSPMKYDDLAPAGISFGEVARLEHGEYVTSTTRGELVGDDIERVYITDKGRNAIMRGVSKI